jgi:hypothetical protein
MPHHCRQNGSVLPGTVRVFRQKFTLEDAIGSHACSLEALACVCPMAFLSGVRYLLPLPP